MVSTLAIRLDRMYNKVLTSIEMEPKKAGWKSLRRMRTSHMNIDLPGGADALMHSAAPTPAQRFVCTRTLVFLFPKIEVDLHSASICP